MRRMTAVLLAGLVALLPACTQEASAQERIANAASATQGAQTARFEMDIAMEGGAQTMAFTANGAMDFAAQKSSITLDLGAAFPAAGMSKMKIITEGTTIYMRMPNAGQRGVKTPWVKIDAESMPGMQGLGGMQQLTNDPSDSMQMLRGVSDDITEVGTEDVRGVATTHYRATLDLERAAESAPEEAQAFVRQQLQTLGTSTLPVDVWIDDEGRVRRQRVDMDLSTMTGGSPDAPSKISMTFELFDFGAPVDVSPPPPEKVTDMADMNLGG